MSKSTRWTNKRAQQFQRPLRSASQYSFWLCQPVQSLDKNICHESTTCGSQQYWCVGVAAYSTGLHREKITDTASVRLWTVLLPTTASAAERVGSAIDVIGIMTSYYQWRHRNHDVVLPMTSEGWWRRRCRFITSSFKLPSFCPHHHHFILAAGEEFTCFHFSAFISTVKPSDR
jgi:hypothetical protein